MKKNKILNIYENRKFNFIEFMLFISVLIIIFISVLSFSYLLDFASHKFKSKDNKCLNITYDSFVNYIDKNCPTTYISPDFTKQPQVWSASVKECKDGGYCKFKLIPLTECFKP